MPSNENFKVTKSFSLSQCLQKKIFYPYPENEWFFSANKKIPFSSAKFLQSSSEALWAIVYWKASLWCARSSLPFNLHLGEAFGVRRVREMGHSGTHVKMEEYCQ